MLKKIDRNTKIEYVAHWRLATHGPACLDLSHPFSYEDEENGKVLVFHNGIISIKTDPNESDTSTFVKRIMSQLTPGWWNNVATRYLVENAVGWSRLAIMTETETVRLNQKDWKKDNGIYYSTDPRPSDYGVQAKVIYTAGKGWSEVDEKPSASRSRRPYESAWRDDDDELINAPEYKGLMLPAGELVDDDDSEEDVDVITVAADKQWYNLGHPVEAITGDSYEDGEAMGTVVCTVCQTSGEWYMIEGRRYIDIAHISSLL